jgi:hypothetical protein
VVRAENGVNVADVAARALGASVASEAPHMGIARLSPFAVALLFATPYTTEALAEPPTAAPVRKPTRQEEVLVHIDAPAGVWLEAETTIDDDWQRVCSAPCDELLPSALSYRVAGDDIKSSDGFTLQASPGSREKLTVDGASDNVFTLSIVGITLGSVAATVGTCGWLVGWIEGNGEAGVTARNTDLAVIGLGSLLAIGGAILAVSTTKVQQDLGSREARAPPDTSSRTPIWATSSREPRSLAPTVGIPILRGQF